MQRSATVDIIGRACRLPGAADCNELWRVLAEGRCTVGEIGDERWLKAHYFNPRQGERGKSYTFAAGVLDDVWGFDPAVFGLSPREAENMDPQQRILLQVVWEALEDAGVPPTRLAGANVGVYVGVSSPDTATRRSHDVGATDAYTMTGSTLSLVSNRISYVFDWHGPSFSVDTACSSALVALSQALDALQAGIVDTAVVGGVNMLLSPFPFLGFAAARMLAPDGRCRPFDANGQGYVRAEGAVALVLRRRDTADIGAVRRYAEVVAAGVNSDGKTSGISLPSSDSQAALLESVYARAGIDPDELAFVEAHGTGTRVGDPAEAGAIGRVLGMRRKRPLLIGSIKSNIGHLEPAAGLAGVLKALLAFEHGVLPASLHFQTPNPAIPFAKLKLQVAAQPVTIDTSTSCCAGVSAFGFGGTNAHVVLRSIVPAAAQSSKAKGSANKGAKPPVESGAGLLMVTAQCREGLMAQARAYRSLAAELKAGNGENGRTLAAAWVAHREVMAERLVVTGSNVEEQVAGLDAFLSGIQSAGVITGRAVGREAKVAFVYTGNGSQWAGMGRIAFERNEVFRRRMEALSRQFFDIAGWSLIDMLRRDDLDKEITGASIAQPLLFAIQASLTDALAAQGLAPQVVLGHSVGEIAAAYASGALDEQQALHVIAARSSSQELARGAGTMAALALPAGEARQLLDECGASAVEIGAVNSPKSVTLSGPRGEIERCAAIASARGLRVKVLDLEYPFHSALVDVAKEPLMTALSGLEPRKGALPFVSTVTGGELAGNELDADYWWRNVRSPVRFAAGLDTAFELGARVFVEISPRAILQGYLAECLGDRLQQSALVPSLSNKDDPDHDPVRLTTARALSRGAKADVTRAFGAPLSGVRLPLYPWQNKQYDVIRSPEATSMLLVGAGRHRYLGWQDRDGTAEWFSHLDIALFPELADHRIGGQVYVPGAVLAEMALAAADNWMAEVRAEVYDLDILAPLVLQPDSMREVRTRIEPASRSLQIASRRRLSDEDWQVHVEARFGPAGGAVSEVVHDLARLRVGDFDAARFYRQVAALGLDYGLHFRRLASVNESHDGALDIAISPGAHAHGGGLLLDPIALDVAFHGLLHSLLGQSAERGEGYVPIRFGRITAHHPGAPVTAARIKLHRVGITTARCDVLLFDETGLLVAEVQDARFRSSTFVRSRSMDELAYRMDVERVALAPFTPPLDTSSLSDIGPQCAGHVQLSSADEEAFLLLEAAARRVSLDVVTALASGGHVSIEDVVRQGRVDETMRGALEGLLGRLRSAGLVIEGAREWRLAPEADLPPLDAIIQTVLAEHPQWWPDCAVLASASAAWPELVRFGMSDEAGLPYASSLLDALAVASPRARWSVDAVAGAVAAFLDRTGVVERPMRVLEIGCGEGALTRQLVQLLADRNARIIAIDDDRRAVERLRPLAVEQPMLSVLGRSEFAKSIEDLGPFDLVVSSDGLHSVQQLSELLAHVSKQSGATVPVIATASDPGAYHDVVFGLEPTWFEQTGRSSAELETLLRHCGCEAISVERGTPGALILGELPGNRAASEQRLFSTEHRAAIALTGDAAPAIYKSVQASLRAQGWSIHELPISRLGDRVSQLLEETKAVDLVWMPSGSAAGVTSDTGELVKHLSQLTSLFQILADRSVRLWIIAAGSLRDQTSAGSGDPILAGIAAFARTAANEHPNVDVRVLDFDAALPVEETAKRVACLLSHPGQETELVLREHWADALRAVGRIADNSLNRGDDRRFAARLELSHDPGAERLVWRSMERREPGPGEIEIEVAATGLNFRDCMWSMGLLPEEALEDGFAGPTLGFECSGTILRVGPGVSELQPGEKVIAFAPAAFASHVTVAASAVARLPEAMSLDAAATVPVPFITAYYAMEHLARLQEGESILIHGGAGGVGLAALQIAKWRGATVFATAGSRDKRELLGLLGADHVFDSRSLAFADDIMRITEGRGVDVVLNSLAGEAMERSLAIVKPFGRFLELGKRDFYGATKIGLRPFRRNVSYFGIDADQLLAQKPELSRRLFAELSEHLASGTFVPLPYRKFEARSVGEAFRLMQQSGHIGKIIVAPPDPALVPARTDSRPFEADPAGVHIVIGGLGGFGLATAGWLVDRGARRVVLASRSGKPAEADTGALAALKARGAEVVVATCDVTSAKSVEAMLADARKSGPIRGVIHAAMVLDDDFIARLDPARLEKVLLPKVAGAENLDRLTRADDLQYFVLYSSVTVLIGNPGQAAYVAANGYLEGLARARRAEGLPALAIGWGGITDAGYLARNAEIGKAIERRTGTSEFTAGEALAALGELLARGAGAPATLTIAPMSWGASRDHLPLLRKPLFARLLASEGGAPRAESVDIASQIGELSDADARDLVCGHLSEEVARIFRMPVSDVSPSRSLAELGMDSLMGLELRVAVQQRLGADIPLSAMAGNQTLAEIAARIVSSLRAGNATAPQVSKLDADLAQQHVASGIDSDKLAPLMREIDRRDTRIGAR